MAGIYIHIPFCKQACHYCDFHFSTNLKNKGEMVAAIAREIQLQKHYLTADIETIYFGGGTPSMLTAEDLKIILDATASTFQFAPEVEMTLEANPDDLSRSRLDTLKQAGFNRLSIGIQSFNDDVLRYFNRAHSSAEALACMTDARAAGFKNISIDLIYAVPDRSLEDWKNDIVRAIELQPEHISAYALTIEPGTAFGIWQKRGKINPVEEVFAAEQLEVLMHELGQAGYEHYEVSNFCRPGFFSRHNSSYWKQQPYLGVGPSAHSYNGASRQFNVSNNVLYLRSMAEDKIPFELEKLSIEDHVNEYLLTTLRTIWGTDLSLLKEKYGYAIAEQHKDYLSSLLTQGHAIIQGNTLILTPSGKLLADKISSDLFMEKSPGVV